MLIKRIKAKNYKTYLNLDLDISVEPDKPIVLIGGANGGGKTTFFESINGALYGLRIANAKQFRELLNAGATGVEDEKIVLELHFSGRVLNEEQQYVLTRTYILNPSGQPVESVKLNMNGTIFSYGTATAPTQRAEQEAQVNKIIKANLPQELSKYFLFDAMEAGNLLKEDQLNRVIKENIENVMGFNKYLQLAKAAEGLCQDYTAQRLEVENEKKEYLALLEQKKKLDLSLQSVQNRLSEALSYSVGNQSLYDNLKNGLNQETTIKNKIDQLQLQIANVQKRETKFRDDVETFIKEAELSAFVPRLVDSVKSEVMLIVKSRKDILQNQSTDTNPETIKSITTIVVEYLRKHNLILTQPKVDEIVDFVLASSTQNGTSDPYEYLDFSEVNALEELLYQRSSNPFPMLKSQQVELNVLLEQIPVFQSQIETMKAQITGRDYTLMKAFEDNEANIKTMETEISTIKNEIASVDRKLHKFDIQTSQEPDPRYETLLKLKPFFEEAANQLLKAKKRQVELKMKTDLNTNLAAYRDVIDRVELSENLRDLTFKIYHKAGNEIYLNQLNTASKQVVIQVLLKALHEFGDYDPPVMIDTVMGVLDEKSRATILENYFPELSQQTILLSSDSEIRPGKDVEKIEPFISKSFTLKRDVEQQSTTVVAGYFGIEILA